MPDSLLDLADEQYVSLTTFRRSGVGVATAVWVARHDGPDGARLVVTTLSSTGKAKRVRRDPHVTLVGCSRSGVVAPGATPVAGSATLVTDPAQVLDLSRALRRKYGLLFAAFTLAGRLPRRRQGERVMLEIAPV